MIGKILSKLLAPLVAAVAAWFAANGAELTPEDVTALNAAVVVLATAGGAVAVDFLNDSILAKLTFWDDED